MIRTSLAAVVLLVAASANAQVVVHGNLTSDSGSTFISDTVTGRQYLRFDQYNLTYADTLIAVAPGGIYEEWSIADRVVAEGFIDSFLGGTSICNGQGFQGACGTVVGWSDGDFGDSSQPTDDTLAFLSDTGIYTFGSIGIRDDGVVFEQEAWGNVETLDFWGHVLAAQINLLLYRDVPVDTDGDGVTDADDNCPLIPNPDQTPSLVEPDRGVACEGLPPGC